MLNTENRAQCLLIWSAITVIVASFLWSFLEWPRPVIAMMNVIESDFGAFVLAHQTLVAGLAGFGSIAIALVFSGWRDREARRGEAEAFDRRMGGVLYREACELAAACDQAGQLLEAKPAALGSLADGLKDGLASGDYLLLTAPASDIARLGPGASAAMRLVRDGKRRLIDTVDGARGDGTGAVGVVAGQLADMAVTAREAARIYAALAAGGSAAADRLRVWAPSAVEAMPLASEAGPAAAGSSRLLPAA